MNLAAHTLHILKLSAAGMMGKGLNLAKIADGWPGVLGDAGGHRIFARRQFNDTAAQRRPLTSERRALPQRRNPLPWPRNPRHRNAQPRPQPDSA